VRVAPGGVGRAASAGPPAGLTVGRGAGI